MTRADLRREAVARTFFAPTDLAHAIERLGFVQADPIRAPARAQDLILRHRVVGYRAGDLEAAYPSLPVFEDMLHVYGFVHGSHRALLHPRRLDRRFHVEESHPRLRRAILAHLTADGAGHPRSVEEALSAKHPRASIVNDWGGNSSATTRMLQALHHRGLVHVARRERGVRVYALPPVDPDRVASRKSWTPDRRADGLIGLVVDLYAPVPRSTLTHLVLMIGRGAIPRERLHARIAMLLRRGALEEFTVEGMKYLRPGVAVDRVPLEASAATTPRVRFLAPFDPLVWDRRRFEHLWDWDYRFEAYTPESKRRFGYYALPLLWDDGDDAQVVGWVNASARRTDRGVRVDLDPGFVRTRPRSRAFRVAYDAEHARLTEFLNSDD